MDADNCVIKVETANGTYQGAGEVQLTDGRTIEAVPCQELAEEVIREGAHVHLWNRGGSRWEIVWAECD